VSSQRKGSLDSLTCPQRSSGTGSRTTRRTITPVGSVDHGGARGAVDEESLWLGTTDRPLFGRLTTPVGDTSKGGVLLSPPIGRESRLARRALRTLAIYLAVDGYVSLRFDHFGTGDSSGSLDDDDFDQAWVEGVGQGVALLRSLGSNSVSAVGMRMGATILGKAASTYDLGLLFPGAMGSLARRAAPTCES
jgi:pimeloyl-ACP methyl ester carboxylesterase